MQHAIATFVCTVVALCASSFAQPAPDGNRLVSVSAVSDTTAVEAGKPFRVAVTLTTEPHWHIYWLYPGDSGQPTEIKFELPAGFTASELQWPTPSKFELPGPIFNFGYEGAATFIATITPPADTQDKEVKIGVKADWLVCDPARCVPGGGAATLSLPVGKAAPANEKLFAAAAKNIPGETGLKQVSANTTPTENGFKYETKLSVQAIEPMELRKTDWFIAIPEGYEQVGRSIQRSMGNLSMEVEFRKLAGNNATPARIYSVIALTDSSQNRSGFSLWLDVSGKPLDGGREQPGK